MRSKLSPPGIYLLRWGGLGGRGWRGGVCSQAMSWQVERRQTWTCLRAQPCTTPPPDTTVAQTPSGMMLEAKSGSLAITRSQRSVSSWRADVLLTMATIRWNKEKEAVEFPLKQMNTRDSVVSVTVCIASVELKASLCATSCGFFCFVLFGQCLCFPRLILIL